LARKRAIEFLNQLLEEYHLDAILITNLINVRYLSGFTGSEGTVIFSQKGNWFLTDPRYRLQAEQEVKGFKVKIFKKKIREIYTLFKKLKAKKVGFEPFALSYQFFNLLKNELKGIKLIPLNRSLLEARAIKDKDERENIEKAVSIAERGLSQALNHLKSGITELDFASELEYQLRKAGSQGPGFETIVASGARSALPHAKADNKVMKKGEIVVIDFSANCQGYFSDLTITIALGEPDKKAKEIYQIVSDAQKLAIGEIKPEKLANQIDKTARNYIKSRGYGKFFEHGLGHGLGLEVHEQPAINHISKNRLKTGMVFTVEPGIYLPGNLGVRIEDDVILEDNKPKVLSKSNQALRIFE